MLHIKRYYKSILSIIALGVGIPAAYILVSSTRNLAQKTHAALFTPTSFDITFHSFYNPEHTRVIEHKIKQQFSKQAMSIQDAEAFERKLKSAHPYVKSLKINLAPPSTLIATITGVQPRYYVNNKYILGDLPELFSQDLFPQINVEKLEHVVIDEKILKNKTLPKVAFKLLSGLQPETTKDYDVTYFSHNKIVLKPKKALCRCDIITNTKNFFNHKKLDALSCVFQDLCNKGLITKKYLEAKNTPLAFDLRVSDQIIVRFFKPATRGKGT